MRSPWFFQLRFDSIQALDDIVDPAIERVEPIR